LVDPALIELAADIRAGDVLVNNAEPILRP